MKIKKEKVRDILDKKIVKKCKRIIKCDTARISRPNNMMYLIIGFERKTMIEEGQWVKNGKPFEFSYIEEKVVASGENEKELIESCKEYKRVLGMTWEKYPKETKRRNHNGLGLQNSSKG